MEQSLKIVQDLYDKGYVTYPRTNSEYLETAEKGKIKTILASVKGLGYPVEFKDDKKINKLMSGDKISISGNGYIYTPVAGSCVMGE